MTEQETRGKIFNIIREFNVKKRRYSTHTEPSDDDELADALIAAGIGDVKEAEHRAEVAERAVYNLAYGEWQREGARRAICEKYAPSTAQDYLDRAEKELAEENDGKKEV